MKKEIMVPLIAVLLASVLVIPVEAAESPEATVYFFDVGEGDSFLIKVDDKNILIDGGTTATGLTLLGYLNGAGVTHLDFMVATHPHEEHIGGLIIVLESAVTVDTVLYNGYNDTSQTCQQFLALANQHNLTKAKRNDLYPLSSTSNFTILSPTQPLGFGGIDSNANCIVLKLQIGNVSFLFEGDATAEAEQSILNAGLNVSSNVLKVVHHGTRTGTSQAFLVAVNPVYTVISTDTESASGPYHEDIVQRLTAKGVITYGTYVSGTLVFTTDGNTVTVQDNPEPIPESLSLLALSLAAATISISIFYARKHRQLRCRHGF